MPSKAVAARRRCGCRRPCAAASASWSGASQRGSQRPGFGFNVVHDRPLYFALRCPGDACRPRRHRRLRLHQDRSWRVQLRCRRGRSGPARAAVARLPRKPVLLASRRTGAHADRTVVLCDLKGYGASRAPSGGPLGEGYSKREMAAELVAVMEPLGHDRFAVVGHDRGGRVAYRMAFDSPQRVERLCVLNIVPTVDQFERMAQSRRRSTTARGSCSPSRRRSPSASSAPAPSTSSATRSRRGQRALARSTPTPSTATSALSRPSRSPRSAPIIGPRSTLTARRCRRPGGRPQDPLPRAGALGRGRGRHVRRSAPGLAAVGGRRRRRPAGIRPLPPRGGAGRPDCIAAAIP